MAKVNPDALVCDFQCRKFADEVCAICDRDGCLEHLPVLLTAHFGTVSQKRTETAAVGAAGPISQGTYPERSHQVHRPVRICVECAHRIVGFRPPGGLGGAILDEMFTAMVEHLRTALKAEAAAKMLLDSR